MNLSRSKLSWTVVVLMVLALLVIAHPAAGDTPSSCPDPTACELGSSACDDCIDCALEGYCAPIHHACVESPACIDFASCLDCDSSPTCLDECIAQNPDGAAIYGALVDCVVCLECPSFCGYLADPAPGCNGGQGIAFAGAELNGAATPARITGTTPAPFNLHNADFLLLSQNGGIPSVVQFSGVEAAVIGAHTGSFWLQGRTLLLAFGPSVKEQQRVEFFGPDPHTTADAAREINEQIRYGAAREKLGRVEIRADRRGSYSLVRILGGSAAAALGLSPGDTLGSGNVTDLDFATVADVVAVAQTASNAAGQQVLWFGGGGQTVRVQSIGTGSSESLQISPASSAAFALGLPTSIVYGTDATPFAPAAQ